MSKQNQQLAIIPVAGTSIRHYGERDEVTEIMSRLMLFHPEAQKVGEAGMLAVAQLALLIGANPMHAAGEIYVWPDRDGKVVVDVGIAYYRRIAGEKDTVMWESEAFSMNIEERDGYGVDANDLAGICCGLLYSKYEGLLKLGVPWPEAKKSLARTGYAIVAHKEMFRTKDHTQGWWKAGDPIAAPHGRTWQWVANKRAEKDWYRKMSMVDTTLTDKIKNNVIAQVRQERDKPLLIADTEDSVEEINAELYGLEWPTDTEKHDTDELPVEVEIVGESPKTDPDPLDANNFWEHLSNALKSTIEEVKKIARGKNYTAVPADKVERDEMYKVLLLAALDSMPESGQTKE